MTSTQRSTLGAFLAVTTLFFAWGFITSLIDPLVAAVKGVFTLSDVEAQLSAFAFFIAYGLVSIPAAVLLHRRQAGVSILIALGTMLAGCLVMLAATFVGRYALVLLGLFVVASGITILQVAANPLAAALGNPRYSHFRLTLSQSFNSVGTFIGPYLGATLFLKDIHVEGGGAVTDEARRNALAGIDSAFLWVAAMIAALALFFAFQRRRIDQAVPATEVVPTSIGATFRDTMKSPWAIFGGIAIFLYVGAEVAIGTQMALFLNSPEVWGRSDAPAEIGLLARFLQLDATPGVSLQEAGRAVSLYWGGAMVGRIIGSLLLARFNAGGLLAIFATIAALACAYVALVGGVEAGFIALGIGLFNSIMFPTIFTLTLERSTASQAATSGLLCTAIVGGAFIPVLTGAVSQATGYSFSFVVPMICYLLICAFAVAAIRKPSRALADEPAIALSH